MTTTKTKSVNSRTAGRLIGLVLELPPIIYVALTGTVPGWARVWIWAWLTLWLLLTTVTATRAQEEAS